MTDKPADRLNKMCHCVDEQLTGGFESCQELA